MTKPRNSQKLKIFIFTPFNPRIPYLFPTPNHLTKKIKGTCKYARIFNPKVNNLAWRFFFLNLNKRHRHGGERGACRLGAARSKKMTHETLALRGKGERRRRRKGRKKKSMSFFVYRRDIRVTPAARVKHPSSFNLEGPPAKSCRLKYRSFFLDRRRKPEYLFCVN